MESPGELHLTPSYSRCGREWGQDSQAEATAAEQLKINILVTLMVTGL